MYQLSKLSLLSAVHATIHMKVILHLFHLGNKAVLKYEKIDTKILDLYHTEVPAQFQGKGLAKLLAEVNCTNNMFNDAMMPLTLYSTKDPRVPRQCKTIK